jgi:hypothetical protein
MRLKLTAPLQSRDGTLAKGAKMKNVLAEVKGDIVKAAKRPGAALLLSGTAMKGQGAIGFSGALFVVSGDTLRKIIVSPASESATWAL